MSITALRCSLVQLEGYVCVRENGHPGQCDVVDAKGSTDFPSLPVDHFTPGRLPWLHDSIFEGFGGNWRWATIDYRGVARVHTFEPSFTATGRIEMPRFKANSEPREAFNVVERPQDWQPLLIKRDMRKAGIRCVPTDRFGVNLPIGADPVEAADVVQAPTMASLNLDPVPYASDAPSAYNIRRSEQCRCDISAAQLKDLLARELGVQIDSTASFTVHGHQDNGLCVTVEWLRAL